MKVCLRSYFVILSFVSALITWRLHRTFVVQTDIYEDYTLRALGDANPWVRACHAHTLTAELVRNFTNSTRTREELLARAGAWTLEECPSAVNFYTHAPAFDLYSDEFPISTSAYALRATCQLKITERIMRALDSSMLIIAGTHLGAVRNGGMIPWDDDVDVWIPSTRANAFMRACEGLTLRGGARVHCTRSWNALKLYVLDDSPTSETFKSPDWPHHSPYVDIFLHDELGREVYPDHKLRHLNIVPVRTPQRPWLFGGEVFMGPPRESALKRNDLSECRTSDWNHRLKRPCKAHTLDCCTLRAHFAFSYLIDMGQVWVEQTAHAGRVLAATVLDAHGHVLEMHTVGAHGRLEPVNLDSF